MELVKTSKNESLKVLNKQKASLEIDEEDLENIKDELSKICAASTYVMEISGQLVSNFKENVKEMVSNNILNFFALNLNNY